MARIPGPVLVSDDEPAVEPEAEGPPPADGGASQPRELRRMRQIGLVVFAAQLIGFCIWSAIVWERFAVSWDFSLLYGGATRISHSSFTPALQQVEAHFDAVIMWPLAWLIRLPGNGLILLWVQDLAVVVAGAVGFFWVCEVLERRSSDISIGIKWLAGLALVLLVVNPWIFLTPAFDFHLEALGAVFIVLAARALYRERIWTSLLWVLATLTCGFVAASYVAALAIGALIAGRKVQRLVGAGLLVVGVLGLVLLTELGQGAGFLTLTYGYLSGSPNPSLSGLVWGVITHPSIALKMLWSQRVRILANLAPAGLIGAFWGWASGIALLIVLANSLQSAEGIQVPSFQWFPLYVFVGVGTVLALAKLGTKASTSLVRGGVAALAVIAAADTAGWAAAWTPKLPGTWLRVTPAAGRVLKKLDAMIPKNAPVIVSQGVVGDFPSHPFAGVLVGLNMTFPTQDGAVWAVLAPSQGIETAFAGTQQAIISELGESGHAQLLAHGAGVWGFRWSPPASIWTLKMPLPSAPISGWAVPGAAGHPDLSGAPQNWAAVSNGKAGYVISGDYFRRKPGSYQAKVRLASSGPAIVEAWDLTGNVLLSRFNVAPTGAPINVSFPVSLGHLYPHTEVYRGLGPFSFRPAYIPPGNDIELRVWQPGTSHVSVYSLSLSCPNSQSCPVN